MIAERLFTAFEEAARERRVATVAVGLGYTAVGTDDGSVGLCYTMVQRSPCCTQVPVFRDFEGEPASALLEYVRSATTLERSMGVALVNALNRPRALAMPEDTGPQTGLMTQLSISPSSRVLMVGYFPPVAAALTAMGAHVNVLDRDRAMGDQAQFLDELARSADVLVATATALLDDSLELFLEQVRSGAKTVILGPTTPMVPSVFADLGVTMLAGMVPVNGERVLAAVRQAGGTPAFAPHCRKVFWIRHSGGPERT